MYPTELAAFRSTEASSTLFNSAKLYSCAFFNFSFFLDELDMLFLRCHSVGKLFVS